MNNLKEKIRALIIKKGYQSHKEIPYETLLKLAKEYYTQHPNRIPIKDKLTEFFDNNAKLNKATLIRIKEFIEFVEEIIQEENNGTIK